MRRYISFVVLTTLSMILLMAASVQVQKAEFNGLSVQEVTRGEEVRIRRKKLVHRKNVKNLRAREKTEFVAAVLKLKTMPSPEQDGVENWYDHFVATHLKKNICWTDQSNQGGYGHQGPDVWTWHRAFLLEFEEALRAAAGKPMAIPYWDWTDPDSTTALLADDFMGPGGKKEDNYVVMSGPFRKGQWRLNVKNFSLSEVGQFDDLVRAIGTSSLATTLPSAQEVQDALSRPLYDVAPWDPTANNDQSFRAFVDGFIGGTPNFCKGGILSSSITSTRLHAQAHSYIGGMFELSGEMVTGTLMDVSTSPNDPIFWTHHANLDRIVEQWWKTHHYEYAPMSGGPRGDNFNDIVWPYAPVTNGDMAEPTQTFGYVYDD